jgi:toxin-antitoxin system PIN domain toxin
MAGDADLPDVNVWLALTLADHPHHARAQRYWTSEAADFVAFCRVTALGLLRLTTNATVMAGKPLYRAFRALDEVVFASEPESCDVELGKWAGSGAFGARLWTDAYLTALARSARWRLVTFDRDFDRFAGLEVVRLEA